LISAAAASTGSLLAICLAKSLMAPVLA
jgi:hypothetical protein